MKLILIGEDHLTDLGPGFLLHVLKLIKEKNLSCRIALEVPSKEKIKELLCRKISPKAESFREELLNSALELYDCFAADLAYFEDNKTRETIMAHQIVEQYFLHSPKVIVMLVGALHLSGLQNAIKELNAEIDTLCFCHQHAIVSFFPQILDHLIKDKGYFYSKAENNLEKAKEKISTFIDSNSILLPVIQARNQLDR